METETVNLGNLRKLLKKEQYAKALELCDKTLAQNPADMDLYKVKILCCINLQKFDDALEIADFNGEFGFEKAYCLYRKNKLNEALSLCSSLKTKSDDILHLQAQALYKLQRYDEAAELYNRLAESQSATTVDPDLHTNLYSAFVSAGQGREVLSSFPLDDSSVGNSFDLAYNIACAQISIGDLNAAEKSLQTASELCHRVLSEEGLSDEEIRLEQTAIQLQTALVDILNGRETSSSLELCRNILKSTKRDNELLAVAANNLAVLRGATDLPDSLRRLRNTISSSSEEKLTKAQLMEIRYNRCILLLHLKKIDECVRTLDELDKIYGVTPRSAVIRASVHAVAEDYSASDEVLDKNMALLSSSAQDTTSLIVFKAQTLINRGLFPEAENIMVSLGELRYSPAAIAAIYYLKTLQVSENQISATAPIEFLLTTAKALEDPSLQISDSLRTASLFQIAQELDERQWHLESSQVLRTLLTRCSSYIDSAERLIASSKLAIALSYVQPEEAEKVTRSLPKLDTSRVNARALEENDIPRMAKRGKALEKQSEPERVDDSVTRSVKAKEILRERLRRRRTKFREAYLKKLQEIGKYDPSRPVKPDPERWIPLKHRSYSKRGRKNRNKFVGGQGSGDGAQKDMLKLDAYARAMAAEGTQKKQGVVIEAPAAAKKGRKKR